MATIRKSVARTPRASDPGSLLSDLGDSIPPVATIFLRAIRLEAMIGIYKRERTTTQPVEIDLDIALPSDRVFNSGKVADTIDYAVVRGSIN